jgi:hypothetical protein
MNRCGNYLWIFFCVNVILNCLCHSQTISSLTNFQLLFLHFTETPEISNFLLELGAEWHGDGQWRQGPTSANEATPVHGAFASAEGRAVTHQSQLQQEAFSRRFEGKCIYLFMYYEHIHVFVTLMIMTIIITITTTMQHHGSRSWPFQFLYGGCGAAVRFPRFWTQFYTHSFRHSL